MHKVNNNNTLIQYVLGNFVVVNLGRRMFREHMKKTRQEVVSEVNNSFVCLPCVPCLPFHHPHYPRHHWAQSSPPAHGAIHSLPLRSTVPNADIFQQISFSEKRGWTESLSSIKLYQQQPCFLQTIIKNLQNINTFI